MKKITILTGAGISKESGIETFRDNNNGTWANYNVDDVATPMGWLKNQKLVLEFYNQRRRQILTAEPNAGHIGLVELEKNFDVTIVTQNIDSLHERAGSKKVLHLHGEILKSQSSKYPELVYDCIGDINVGDKCENGSQLRPFVVWFGEAVPNIMTAEGLTFDADIFVVIGTSLQVYPAAGLIARTRPECKKIIIDPEIPEFNAAYKDKIIAIRKPATTGVRELIDILFKELETHA